MFITSPQLGPHSSINIRSLAVLKEWEIETYSGSSQSKSAGQRRWQVTSWQMHSSTCSSSRPSKSSVNASGSLIPGLHYRKIPAVIWAMFVSPLASKFHLSPFRLFHKAPSSKEECDFCRVYESDAYIEENDKIQHAPVPPDDPDCKHEKAVAVVMLWSDATHLANFGMAKLWPIYMLLRNLLKYFCSLPNLGACQNIMYIPSLLDSFQDFAARFHKKWGTQKKDIITHCCRKLMHAVWKFLLDDEFIHAYKYGMVIQCADSIKCHIYPHIFTYSADYPEKWVCFADFLYACSYNFSTTECYLQLYEIRALLPVQDVSLQNPRWTRQVPNEIVNSARRMFVNTYWTTFM